MTINPLCTYTGIVFYFASVSMGQRSINSASTHTTILTRLLLHNDRLDGRLCNVSINSNRT